LKAIYFLCFCLNILLFMVGVSIELGYGALALSSISAGLCLAAYLQK